jgi:hypothetical protein
LLAVTPSSPPGATSLPGTEKELADIRRHVGRLPIITLELQNGRLKLSEMSIKPLPHAEFAFLSPCQAATGHDSLPEEAIHLAAGLLLRDIKG